MLHALTENYARAVGAKERGPWAVGPRPPIGQPLAAAMQARAPKQTQAQQPVVPHAMARARAWGAMADRRGSGPCSGIRAAQATVGRAMAWAKGAMAGATVGRAMAWAKGAMAEQALEDWVCFY